MSVFCYSLHSASRGAAQAAAAACTLGPRLAAVPGGCLIYSSCMRRALQTATALHAELHEMSTLAGAAEAAQSTKKRRRRVIVRPDLFELGGIYRAAEVGAVRGRVGAASATPEDMVAAFPGVLDVSALLPGDGWYGPQGWENEEEGTERAARVVSWLLSRRFQHRHVGVGTVVLVLHSVFIDRLLRALPLCAAPSGRPILNSQRVVFRMDNAATASLSVLFEDDPSAGKKRPRIVLHHINRQHERINKKDEECSSNTTSRL